MKRSVFICLLTLGLLLGTATVSWGCGVFGPTDLMYTPTANSLEAGSLGISVNLCKEDTGYFNFDYGLFSDLEIGILIRAYPEYNVIRFRGKFNVLQEDRDTPGLALGIEDLGSESPVSPYLVLSKAFPNSDIKGHIGVGGGEFHGIFGGLEIAFANSPRRNKSVKEVELFLEFDSDRTNAGAKLGIGANTKINFALTDLKHWMAGVTFLAN
ncbi:MAG: YjbH domain-containing protein [Firmicutes bacterium]|nr:YjbH domain-containing protein [Bacillota bacterium]